MVRSVVVAEKWHRIRQHPNVTAATVVVRFRPTSILIFNGQYNVHLSFGTINIIVVGCDKNK